LATPIPLAGGESYGANRAQVKLLAVWERWLAKRKSYPT